MSQQDIFINRSKSRDNYIKHILLFIFTFLSCMGAGTFWVGGNFTDLSNWHMGLTYALLIMGFLTAHEFGHYFASIYYKVDCTLPYYIPLPLIPGLIDLSFGSLGAVIRIRQQIPSKKALFDIGIAGPFAGFLFCLIFLAIGFYTLPGIEYLQSLHPDYFSSGSMELYKGGVHFGDNLLFHIMKSIFSQEGAFVPPMNEIYHYPFLCVGWFGLFVTALNLMPIGQLDGGHVSYAIFGEKHAKIARFFWWALLILGLSGIFNLLYYLLKDVGNGNTALEIVQYMISPIIWLKKNAPIFLEGWGGWLFWAILVKFVIKLDHPPVTGKIGRGRIFLGLIGFVILVISFSYNGIYEKILE